MSFRQRTDLYFINTTVGGNNKKKKEKRKRNSELLQTNVAALGSWQSGYVGTKVSRHENTQCAVQATSGNSPMLSSDLCGNCPVFFFYCFHQL